MNFHFAGDSARVQITGKTTARTFVTLQDSSGLQVTSQNPEVVTYSNGEVQTLSAGSTTLTFQYSSPESATPVTSQVRISVNPGQRADLDGNGVIDLDDLRILNRALNSPATSNQDSRDLNHDGQINVLDARLLVTLCTHPHCSSY